MKGEAFDIEQGTVNYLKTDLCRYPFLCFQVYF